MGVRIARKHIGWYFKRLDAISQNTKNTINQAQTPTQQLKLVAMVFNHLTSEIAA
jgi:tRNA-dihydrouridine synthase B